MRPVPIATLSTKRLWLREPDPSDIREMTELANDRDVAVRLGTMPHPYTDNDARLFFSRFHSERSSWAICLGTGGPFAGIISLKSEADEHVAGLGYWLGQRYWGRGYATEAAEAVVGYASSLRLHNRLISGYYADNEPSGRVLRKVGFAETGRSTRFSGLRCEDVDYVEMARDLLS